MPYNREVYTGNKYVLYIHSTDANGATHKVDIRVLESFSGVDGDGPALVFGCQFILGIPIPCSPSSPPIQIILLLVTIALHTNTPSKQCIIYSWHTLMN